jgi:hypothetical protein
MATTVETPSPFGPVRDALRDIRAAEEDLRAEQDAALRRYLERVDAILAFRIQLEDEPRDDDHDPTHVVHALRARLDDLRVQAHLGAMEGEDLVARVRAMVRRINT